MYGTTLSLTIALSAALITVAIGTIAGIIAGFTGGFVDGAIGRVIDLTLSFPATLMLLALSGVVVDRMVDLGVPAGATANGLYIVIVLAIFGWPPIARLIRGQVLSIREREFVDAAILMGASRRRIYFKEILPNLWAPLLVYFTLLMPAYRLRRGRARLPRRRDQEPHPDAGQRAGRCAGLRLHRLLLLLRPGAHHRHDRHLVQPAR